MSHAPRLLSTGNAPLDHALGGGLPAGSLVLVRADEGAGATELALCVLRAAVQRAAGARVLFLSATRSAARIQREARELFDDEKAVSAIECMTIGAQGTPEFPLDLHAGDVVVVESAASLARALPAKDLASRAQAMGELAQTTGALVILLETQGTLPPVVAATLGEMCDGLLLLRWREGSTMRRRVLEVVKRCGLIGGAGDGDEIPVYEVGVRRGSGFSVSQVTNVL